MIKNGDTVIVALSGGGDSMALFHFLFLRCKEWGITLRAVHVNHGIRGVESDEDALFVRQLCADWGVALDETRLIPPQGHVSEMWAREKRYSFFEECARKHRAKIALAHTRSDQAETVLLNLARGCAVRGAAGIPPVRGPFIRPLLDVSHEEILTYLKKYGLPYRVDSTNQDRSYTRNAIRLEVLPALERTRPGAEKALARFAENMMQVSSFLDQQAETLLNDAQIQRCEYDASILKNAHPVVCKAALSILIARLVSKEKTALVPFVYDSLFSGGAVQLGREWVLRVSQGRLRAESTHIREETWNLPYQEGIFPLPGGIELEVQFFSVPIVDVFRKDEEKAFNFYADCDKILRTAQFRTRRPGDVFSPPGQTHSKPLKKLYSQAKISPSARAVWPVLVQGSRVLWAAGFGFARGLEITADTKKAVKITIRQMEETER